MNVGRVVGHPRPVHAFVARRLDAEDVAERDDRLARQHSHRVERRRAQRGHVEAAVGAIVSRRLIGLVDQRPAAAVGRHVAVERQRIASVAIGIEIVGAVDRRRVEGMELGARARQLAVTGFADLSRRARLAGIAAALPALGTATALGADTAAAGLRVLDHEVGEPAQLVTGAQRQNDEERCTHLTRLLHPPTNHLRARAAKLGCDAGGSMMPPVNWGVVAFGLMVVVVLVACSDDESSTTGAGGGGAGGQGGAGAGVNDWSCLGTAPQQVFRAGTAAGHFRIVELLDDSPLEGITVRSCARSDESCASPLDEGMTDANGEVTIDVTTAEQRFLEVEGPGMLPVLSFNNGPPNGATFDERIRVLAPDTFAGLEAILGTTGDVARGHAGVQANDCNGKEAVGVIFELDVADADTVIGYFGESGIPETDLVETTIDGRAAVANIPAGPVVLSARLAATGELIGTRTFFVRPTFIHFPACVEADPEAEL